MSHESMAKVGRPAAGAKNLPVQQFATF